MKKLKHLFLFSFIFLFSTQIVYSESYTLDKVSIDLVKPWGMSFIDDENLIFGIDEFGKSAPYKKLFDYFGFNEARILKKIRKLK